MHAWHGLGTKTVCSGTEGGARTLDHRIKSPAPRLKRYQRCAAGRRGGVQSVGAPSCSNMLPLGAIRIMWNIGRLGGPHRQRTNSHRDPDKIIPTEYNNGTYIGFLLPSVYVQRSRITIYV